MKDFALENGTDGLSRLEPGALDSEDRFTGIIAAATDAIYASRIAGDSFTVP
jgi:hypothetical protein